LRLFSNQPDSRPFGAVKPVNPVVTAFPDGPKSFAVHAAKAEEPIMLPGFRVLFAAIVLSVAMLIFGLGAVALLRAAHQEFASIPSRRVPPETALAQRNDTAPSLAMLRVDASAADEVLNPPPPENVQAAAPASDQPAIAPASPESERPATEPDKFAALTDVAPPAESSPASEAAAPETAAAEISSQAETPVPAATPSPAAGTTVAGIAEMPPAAPDQADVTAPAQPTAVDDSTRIAETKIATLGGPPVTVETQRPAKLTPAAVRKPAQARRAVKRRRIVQRAPVARPPPQQPANPFGTRLGG
jgi:hypothetical protein